MLAPGGMFTASRFEMQSVCIGDSISQHLCRVSQVLFFFNPHSHAMRNLQALNSFSSVLCVRAVRGGETEEELRPLEVSELERQSQRLGVGITTSR